ncbi:sarcosine oxidase [Bisporella sp. PMI_857]|nr:sarcosine oxidase [Bisporella sp. PMI_857]
MAEESFIVVGAGCFGASTALHLSKEFQNAKITLIDRSFPNPSAAGHDLNKIIRADYGDFFYTKLALESQDHWRSDPIYAPFYHESGMLYAEDKGYANALLSNLNDNGVKHVATKFSVEEGRRRFDGVYRDSDWRGVENCYFNPQSGWGEAAAALESVIAAAVEGGVVLKEDGAARVVIESGRAVGVITETGEEVRARTVVLCTGAWTPKLLMDSAPDDERIHVGSRMLAAGAVQCTATYPPDQMWKFRSCPILFNGCDHTQGELIPPTRGNVLKFNFEGSFTNLEEHDMTGKIVSIPPKPLDQHTWGQSVPQGLKDDIQNVVKSVFGNWIEGIRIEDYRMCWDAATPNQEFIIDQHSHCDNLYFAGGGSFHGWKFLPVIGKYVVQKIKGTLGSEAARKWAWDRPAVGGAMPTYIPQRDLKDIKGYAEVARAYEL